jgi:hypothetical protein
MKFNPIKPTARQIFWKVSAGRGQVFKANFQNETDATQFAIIKTAEFHMEEAERMVKQITSFSDMKRAGFIAIDIIDHISDTGVSSGEVEEMDSRAWTA